MGRSELEPNYNPAAHSLVPRFTGAIGRGHKAVHRRALLQVSEFAWIKVSCVTCHRMAWENFSHENDQTLTMRHAPVALHLALLPPPRILD